MARDPIAPSWPFGRWHRTAAPARTGREQCQACQGGGEINAVPCLECGERGWFDAQHPRPAEPTSSKTQRRSIF